MAPRNPAVHDQPQGQAVTGVPVLLGALVHFWQQTAASYATIAILYHKGPEYEQEDVLGRRSATSTFRKLHLTRRVRDGLSTEKHTEITRPPLNPSLQTNKPDHIAVKLMLVQSSGVNGLDEDGSSWISNPFMIDLPNPFSST
jgi:hypothetical protein